MMQKLFVYADFNWMDSPLFVGELSYESVRGSGIYGFRFDPDWLKTFPDLYLSEDLQNFTGWQYTEPGKEIFACFSDALPDRWGKTLINRKEQIEASAAHRQPKRLSSFDYLTAIDDFSRMGSFRFSKIKGGEFINTGSQYRIPPIADIRTLAHAAEEIEKHEKKHQLPAEKWIAQLLRPGTSLGGARPKASVIDSSGRLTVAKFPSRSDDYNVGLWEHVAHRLARRCGIETSETAVMKLTDNHIFLSRRFDRTSEGIRIHFASAMTLLGLRDGDNASTGYGYLDIVDFIVSHGTKVESNLEELFRRVAFNIIIGNTDDHFRNHGFVLTQSGWELAPAYDMNPTVSEYQSLLINNNSAASDLSLLKESAEQYFISKSNANRIIEEVMTGMQDWERFAIKLGLPSRDIALFSNRINSKLT